MADERKIDRSILSVTRVPEVGTITVSQDNLVTFVAEDFLEKLRKSDDPSVCHRSEVPVVDMRVLEDLEQYTQQLALSFENVVAKLTSDLHKASAITVGYSQTYKDAVDSMGTKADEAVQSMYSLVAHAEELSKSMEPIHKVHQKIKHVKTLLGALEAQMI